MQFRLHFRTNNLAIPMAHHYQVQSMLYHIFSESSTYGKQLHDSGYRLGSKKFQLFCFGPLTGRYDTDRTWKELLFEKSVTLELRTPDQKLAALWQQLLLPGLEATLCGQKIELASITTTQFRISEERCKIKMLSPILAYRTIDGRRKNYTPLEPEFSALAAQNFIQKYFAFAERTPEPIRLTALAVGLQDKNVTNYKGNYLTGWGGQYQLEGKPEYLEFLYDAGLGARNAAGFGLFRVL